MTGTLKRHVPSTKAEDTGGDEQEVETIEDFYRGEIEEGNVEVLRDTRDIYFSIFETLKKRSSLAI